MNNAFPTKGAVTLHPPICWAAEHGPHHAASYYDDTYILAMGLFNVFLK